MPLFLLFSLSYPLCSLELPISCKPDSLFLNEIRNFCVLHNSQCTQVLQQSRGPTAQASSVGGTIDRKRYAYPTAYTADTHGRQNWKCPGLHFFCVVQSTISSFQAMSKTHRRETRHGTTETYLQSQKPAQIFRGSNFPRLQWCCAQAMPGYPRRSDNTDRHTLKDSFLRRQRCLELWYHRLSFPAHPEQRILLQN